ncbi:hypothetical protein GGTG_02163 [Gaeumannomyces tritici R3-111a-1]|uniref:Uncharacterized protein n=1 Tax=Gaeumannomyces tritici (strain R3-111a-1) TaxID=644352 RepID=J3NLL4_GAET3|nr:hypothetical protein GGTG_02163 [Gaeumannomyces tritici R3-111a-1]EJT82189.1 hypothetical protein GGTG_02163 [Gaeumannomyces tritici R3-111a-1]
MARLDALTFLEMEGSLWRCAGPCASPATIALASHPSECHASVDAAARIGRTGSCFGDRPAASRFHSQPSLCDLALPSS